MTVQVAGVRRAHPFDAFTTQPERFTGLRALGDRNLGFAIQGWHLNVAPQRCAGERNR